MCGDGTQIYTLPQKPTRNVILFPCACCLLEPYTHTCVSGGHRLNVVAHVYAATCGAFHDFSVRLVLCVRCDRKAAHRHIPAPNAQCTMYNLKAEVKYIARGHGIVYRFFFFIRSPAALASSELSALLKDVLAEPQISPIHSFAVLCLHRWCPEEESPDPRTATRT